MDIPIRFSDCQQKECIHLHSGKMIGYIYDAKVSVEDGTIEYFLIAPPKKFYQFKNKDSGDYKIYISEIVIIGKDVIIVNSDRL